VANAGASYTNVVTVQGMDDRSEERREGETGTVTYANVAPSIAISKAVSPASLSEGDVGVQSVSYTYTVTNTSPASTDPVTITSLSDDKAGNLLGAFLAANGGSNVLAVGASVTFSGTQSLPVANAGASYTNVVTVQGMDD